MELCSSCVLTLCDVLMERFLALQLSSSTHLLDESFMDEVYSSEMKTTVITTSLEPLNIKHDILCVIKQILLVFYNHNKLNDIKMKIHLNLDVNV